MVISLDQIKKQCHIGYDEDDEHLMVLAAGAEAEFLRATGRTLDEMKEIGGGQFPADFIDALLVRVAERYAKPEGLGEAEHKFHINNQIIPEDMKAGRLTEFLIPMHLVTETDPESGAITRRWVEEKVIRADRTRSSVKAEMRGPEGFIQADAVYYIRIQDHVEDGWRVRDRTDGKVYDVVTDRCTDRSMLMLKCTKVNE